MIGWRKTTQGDMVTYMEEDVYKALCEVTYHSLKADAWLKHCNEVSRKSHHYVSFVRNIIEISEDCMFSVFGGLILSALVLPLTVTMLISV